MVKKILYLCLVCLIVYGCKKAPSPAATDELLLPPGEEMVDGCIEMQSRVVQSTVEWRGLTWIYEISRKPDSGLPQVADDDGYLCTDNRVSLSILQGEREVLLREFTKADFRSYVAADFYDRSVLEGLVFYRAADEGLQFATSLSYPHGSDNYVSLLITVDEGGSVSIRQDDLLDDEDF